MMKSALLFYRKLVADLLSIGFIINPYDPCVANKTIKGKQMTICWHVDDLFIGHEDPSAVSHILAWLANRYDTADKKLNVTHGPRHDYLGMTIDFSTPGSVSYDMIPYISKVIDAFPEKITGTATSPASDRFFKSNHLPTLDFSLKNRHVRIIIPRPNFFFFHVFGVTSKPQLLF